MKKTIYYWCPFFSDIATTKAVLNSVLSIKKYSNKKYNPVIIDVFGEWKKYESLIEKNNIEVIKLNTDKYFKKKKINGFFLSRYYHFKIILFAFIPLYKILKKNSPDIIILHLVTSLPLILNFLFNFKTKFILRISGLPKLNFLRMLFWNIVLKKIELITTPTNSTKFYLKNLFPKNKIYLLRDPIIYLRDIVSKKNKDNQKKNIYVSIGRLTAQKNFLFLLKVFKIIIKKDENNYLYILGSGENYAQLNNFIHMNNLRKNIFLEGYKDNIYDYLSHSKAFILTSLWEDPGFVLLEACYANTSIISSNCKNGPVEILNNGKNGYLYNSGSIKSFINVFNKFNEDTREDILLKKIMAKKMAKKFSIFRHYSKLNKILDVGIYKKRIYFSK
jgi:glycosyltransferase involved in cell wall biosynthesis